MTDQPKPESTDASLEHAEQVAAREATEEAGVETTHPVDEASGGTPSPRGTPATPPSQTTDSNAMPSGSVGEPDIAPQVMRARPPTSEPAMPKSRAEPHHGNGHHKELIKASAEMVQADSVTIHQGSAQTVSAGSMDVRQGAVARVDARDVSVTGGAIGLARGERVSVELGAAGAVMAGEAHLTQGAVNAVIARDAQVHQSLVQTVIANAIRFDRPSAVVFLVARRVDGEVRAIFDWRGGLAFGLAAGFVMSLLRRRR